MAHPALESMSYDELAQLVDEAKKLMAEKFENNPGEWADKLRSREKQVEAERLEGATPPNVN